MDCQPPQSLVLKIWQLVISKNIESGFDAWNFKVKLQTRTLFCLDDPDCLELTTQSNQNV